RFSRDWSSDVCSSDLTLLSLVLSLVRMKGMVKLLDVPQQYLWSGILIFCIIGTYATSNSLSTVITMLVFGVVGVLLKRMQVPARSEERRVGEGRRPRS